MIKLRSVILVAAALGILISAYSTYSHYSPSDDTFCDLSKTLSCSIVNKSIYSEVAGIPVAIVGLLGYAFIFILAFKKTPWKYIFAAAVLGFLFSGYLTWIEIYALQTYCILCLTSQMAILLIAVTSGVLYAKKS